MSSFGSNTLTTIIASGAALSGPVDIGDNALVAVTMPASGIVTFQGSADGSTYYNIYEENGTEYSATLLVSGMTTLDLNQFLAPRRIKVRTGTAASPSNRSSAIIVTLVAKEI